MATIIKRLCTHHIPSLALGGGSTRTRPTLVRAITHVLDVVIRPQEHLYEQHQRESLR